MELGGVKVEVAINVAPGEKVDQERIAQRIEEFLAEVDRLAGALEGPYWFRELLEVCGT